VLRTLAIFAALLAALGVLVAFGFFPQRWLTLYVERRLRESLGAESRVGRLHVWPGQLRAEAHELVIAGPGYRLEVPEARVELAWSTLIGRAFALKQLELERPSLRLEATSTTAGARGTSAAPVTRPVLVGDIAITGGRIVYHDPALGGDVRVSDLQISGGVGKHALQLQTGDVRWDRPKPLILEPIRATVSIASSLESQLDSLEIATSRSHLRASGPLGNIAALDPRLQLDLDLDLDDAELAAPGAGLRGRLRGEGHVNGLGSSLHADLRLEGQSLRIGGRAVDELRFRAATRTPGLEASFDGRTDGAPFDGHVTLAGDDVDAAVRATELDLASLGGSGSASGTTGRVSVEASARGRMGERLSTSATMHAVGRTSGALSFEAGVDVSGAVLGRDHRLDLSWTATGTTHQPAGTAPTLQQATLAGQGSATGDWPPAVAGRLHGDGIVLSEVGSSPFALEGDLTLHGAAAAATLQVDGELGHMSVTASRDAREAHVDVTGRGIALARFLRAAHGEVELSYHGAGPTGSFEGSGHAEATALTWHDLAVGPASVHVETHGDVTTIDAAAPELKLRGEAQIVPGSRRAPALQLEAHLHFDDTPLSRIQVAAGETPLEATARGEIVARGPLADLATAAQLEVPQLAVTGPGMDVALSGSAGLGRDAPIEAKMEGRIDLARLPVPLGWRIEGAARASVEISGTAARPEPHGRLELQGVSVSQRGFPPLRMEPARIELTPQSVSLPETKASFASGTIAVAGEAPLAALWPGRGGTETGRLDLRWEDIDVAQIQSAADEPLTGRLTGDAHLEGSWRAPGRITGRVQTPALTLAVGDVTFAVSAVDARLANRRLSVSPITIGTRQGELRVEIAADLDQRTLDSSARGAVDLKSLSPFMSGGGLDGRADLDLRVTGPWTAPHPEGRLDVRDGRLHLRDIATPLTDVAGAVVLEDAQLRLPSFTGKWGGGDVTVSGSAALDGAAFTDVTIKAVGKDLALRYDEAKLRIDADVALTGRTGHMQLGGNVHLLRGLYDKDIFIGQGIGTPVVEPTNSPLLRSIALDLKVQTDEPFLVRNNLAQIQTRGSLTVRGDAQNPAPFGTLHIAENGRVRLQERDFRIESGTITYTGSADPGLGIRATVVKPVEWQEGPGASPRKRETMITVDLRGTLSRPVLELSSDAEDLSSVELTSLLATGRPNPGSERGAWVVGEQAAQLLAGPLSHELSSKLRGLGFDEVSIEPTLIARETNPAARFTFGKNLNHWSSLIYSLGLDSAEDRFVQLNLHPVGDFTMELERDETNAYTTRLSHVLRVGQVQHKRGRSEAPVALDGVTIVGAPAGDEAAVAQWIGLKVGNHATYWDLENRADRARSKLINEGRIEADISVALDGRHATFHVSPGPIYTARITGLPDPPDLTKQMRRARYADEALENGEHQLLAVARQRGHFTARVESSIEGTGDRRTLVFDVTLGPRYAGADVDFAGASTHKTNALLNAAGGAGELATAPQPARRRIEQLYRREYYLTTVVRPPIVEEATGRLRIRVPIQEGPPAHVTQISYEGDEGELSPADREALGRPLLGERPSDTLASEAAQKLREHYFQRGYAAVRVSPTFIPHPPDLELHFQIQKGPRTLIEQIDIQEPAAVSPRVIERELPIRVGEPLDPRKLARAEARLEKFGLSRVSLRSDDEDPGRIVVETRARSRAIARYSLEYGTDVGAGVSLDAQAPNLLRFGLTPGLSLSYDRNRENVRGWLKLPAFIHRGLFSLTASVENLKLSPATLLVPVHGESRDNLLTQSTRSVQVLQQVELSGRWQLEYGYEFDRVRIFGTPDPGAFVECGPKGGFCVGDLGQLKVSLLRDTRDHLLDARRGRFWSISVSYAPTALGSGATFAKAFGQVSTYRALGTGNLTWAQSYRVGVGQGFAGQPLFLRERFSAGGAFSLRGFATDSVGPRNALGQPELGDAVIVLNQELRYHHPTNGLGAAIFYDGGNVYSRAGDIGFPLRHSVGVGLRYASPIGLLRVDFGFPVNPYPGDSNHQIFFSLGQAF
jgi:outer membrane protein assembly factor BamA/autotransporter translocation and assembly factor TamB